jgi:hypothetical protein
MTRSAALAFLPAYPNSIATILEKQRKAKN